MYKKNKSVLIENLQKMFPFEPTHGQAVFFEKIADFVASPDMEFFILRGYAGTGKTTLLTCMIPVFDKEGIGSVLLAPTGRSAKVMAGYTKKTAVTIHKKIYTPKESKTGTISFTKKKNSHKNTLFFVDESSMLSNEGANDKLFNVDSVLSDLIEYVREGKQCKLVFMGDTAQLPPVKQTTSPALEVEELSMFTTKDIGVHTLEEVTRQSANSGILVNATLLRDNIKSDYFETFQFRLDRPDICRLEVGDDTLDAITTAYQKDVSQTVCIVRSNKRANQYNAQIRSKILSRETAINVGERLMCVRNNYFWLKPESQIGFIANGDTFEVLEILKYTDLYGFNFVRVKAMFLHYSDLPPTEMELLLDTLESETPSLPYEDSQRLYQEVGQDYSQFSRVKQREKIKANPYFNAIQVKYAYAVTCHKSQGGQWDHVFVEQPYLPSEPDQEFYRWLYTAMTRAKKKLYLIGFKRAFFGD